MGDFYPVELGEPIRLTLQLADDDIGLFPQVTLTKADGVAVVGSPVDLPHVLGGLYVDVSILYPLTPQVWAQFRVFKDALHTKLHPVHCNTIFQVFKRDTTAECVAEIKTKINAIVSGSLPGSFLEGFLDDDGELTGELLDDEVSLVGEIEDAGELDGFIFVEDDLLFGEIDDPQDTLTGFILC